MLLTPMITQCDNCSSVKEMVDRIDCSLYHLIRNKWNNEAFNVSLFFCNKKFKDLERYRRILYERIYNPCYPCKDIDAQDILAKAGRILYGDSNCSKCAVCTTSSTCRCYLVTGGSPTPGSPTQTVTYVDCNGNTVETGVGGGPTSIRFCALVGSVITVAKVEDLGDCSTDCTTDSTTTTTTTTIIIG